MLTTKILIREVEKLGLVAIVDRGRIQFENSKGHAVACIDVTTMCVLDATYCFGFRELSGVDRKRLLDLLGKYANTPIEDRDL